MARGKTRINNGPCVICNKEDTNEIFRKLTKVTKEKVKESPHAHIITVQLKVGDQLCQEHYNKLVVFNRNKITINKRKNQTKDISYHSKKHKEEQVHISQEDNTTIFQLEQQIIELKSEINNYINNGNHSILK